MKNSINNQIRLLCMIALLSLSFSCTRDVDSSENLTENNKPDPNNAVVKILLEKGLELNEIYKLSNGDYLVLGDIIISGDINDHKNDETENRQYSSDVILSAENAAEILVYMQPMLNAYEINNTDHWGEHILNAMDIWSTVYGCDIQFFETENISEADIIIQSDLGLLPNNSLAAAAFPEANRAGENIIINLDYNDNVTVTNPQKLSAMTHELGHTIGFRHTNWDDLGEPETLLGLFHIEGTPEGNDPHSIMNGGNATSGFSGLSYYDKVALRALYPW